MSAVRPRWLVALLGATLLMGVATAANAVHDVGRPFGGIIAYRNHLRNTWQLDPSTPSWWPGLAPTALRYDDVLVALDGASYGPDSQARFARAWQQHRTSVRVTLLRGGASLEVDLPVTLITRGHFIDMKLPDLINGLGFWLLALAVFRGRPGDPVNRVFAVMSAAMAAAAWLLTPGLFPESGTLTRLLHLAWIAAFCTLTPSFIHLTFLFPKPFESVSARTIARMYAVSAFLSLPYWTSMILGWRDPASSWAHVLSTASNAGAILLMTFGLGLHVLRLIWLWRRSDTSRRLRRQVGVLLGGWILFSPFLAVMALRTLGTHGAFWHGLDLRCMVLTETIAIAFLILRYQTFQPFDSTIVAVLILATSSLLASLATWIMRLVEPEWSAALHYTPFVPLFGAVLVTSVAWSTQTSWRGALGRLVSWDRRSYDGVRQFGQEVVNRATRTEIRAAIVETLVEKMELERAALWLRQRDQNVFVLAARAGDWPQPPVATLAGTVATNDRSPIRLRADDGGTVPLIVPLHDSGLEVVAPLWASDEPTGLLGLGKRWDDEIFDERDLEIVELVAQQAALLLLTAAQVEELRQVPNQIAATQERERFRIAQELHDTVQQFLGRLPFYLAVSRKAARDQPAETESILERCMADVESAAQTVREIRANLAPLQLETSLMHPLRRLIDHFSVRSSIAVETDFAAEADACLDVEARHALYRVVQQALDNAATHAEASRISVTITAADGRVRFAIVDDGRGFSDIDRAAAQARGSFGLKSMHARITSVGGELSADSAPGAGTRISGWLPASIRRAVSPEG